MVLCASGPTPTQSIDCHVVVSKTFASLSLFHSRMTRELYGTRRTIDQNEMKERLLLHACALFLFHDTRQERNEKNGQDDPCIVVLFHLSFGRYWQILLEPSNIKTVDLIILNTICLAATVLLYCCRLLRQVVEVSPKIPLNHEALFLASPAFRSSDVYFGPSATRLLKLILMNGHGCLFLLADG